MGLQAGHARVLGNWMADGSLRRNPPGYSESISHAQLWTIVRLHERIEAQGFVPILLNARSSGGTRQAAGGVGDVGAAVRWQLVAIGELHRVPSLALTAGFVAPTGRRVEETSPPLFAGTTGAGAWGASLAVQSEIAPHPWFVRLDLGGWLYRGFTRADTGAHQEPGILVRGGLSAGREVTPSLVLAASLSVEWQGRVHVDGEPVPASQARLVMAAASASWRMGPHWTIVSSVGNSWFPDGFGKNRDARIDGTLGVRYGWF